MKRNKKAYIPESAILQHIIQVYKIKREYHLKNIKTQGQGLQQKKRRIIWHHARATAVNKWMGTKRVKYTDIKRQTPYFTPTIKHHS